MQKLFIFPFNGNGMEAMMCIPASYELVGFIDDTPGKQGEHPWGFEVYPRTQLSTSPEAKILAVPGSTGNYLERDQVIESLKIPSSSFATVISPGARISPLATIGHNVLIMDGVVITSNAVIGNHVIILPNTVVHHDVVIGDYSIIGSGVCISGYSKIGRKCYIGSGSTIINNITIGDMALIGLGSNIIRDVPASGKIAGNPGRPI